MLKTLLLNIATQNFKTYDTSEVDKKVFKRFYGIFCSEHFYVHVYSVICVFLFRGQKHLMRGNYRCGKS